MKIEEQREVSEKNGHTVNSGDRDECMCTGSKTDAAYKQTVKLVSITYTAETEAWGVVNEWGVLSKLNLTYHINEREKRVALNIWWLSAERQFV